MRAREWGAASDSVALDCASWWVAAGQGLNFWWRSFVGGETGGHGASVTCFWSESDVFRNYPSDSTGLCRVRRRDAESLCCGVLPHVRTSHAVNRC